MTAQSPELQQKIADWRAKSVAGTLTMEEMRQAIIALRSGRVSAATAPSSSKSKSPPRAADEMLGELGI